MKKTILCFCLCLYCIGVWAASASFKKTGNDLLFFLPQGNVKLEFCTDDMFRVRHSQGTVFAENEQWMVRKYDFSSGGRYQSSTPFSASVCGERQKGRKKPPSETASDYQLTLFPLF